MLTVIETATFIAQTKVIWRDEERDAFIEWIACNPLAGDVIPGADGVRKVRWTASGKGKRGGARVIYFNLLDEGALVLLMAYIKSKRANISAKVAKEAKHERF